MSTRLFVLSLLSGLLALFAIAPLGLNAQEEVGPKTGAMIEDFSLNDQAGKSHQFSELLKTGPVALVFHRSADW